MKRIKYFMVIAISVLTLLITSCDSSLNPMVMAQSTQGTVKAVKEYNDDVFAEIQKNINLVTDLKNKMANASEENTQPTLDEVIKDIESVTKSYEKLAEKKEAIDKHFKDKIAVIENMQKNIGTEINLLNDRIADYTKQLNELPGTTTDIETLRTRKKALEKAVDYVNTQKQLWVQFKSLEQDITGEMENVQQRINNFIAMIDSSAILFREGLNLLKLQKNISDALSLFTVDMPTIQRLTQDMERSWDDLDYLIKSLTTLTSTMEIN